ncbi:helix-turn-helix domain-containing protein [Sphingosinicellaceae bacterium]|nr:helix-turn-helix domain-containing protein [Sphingosinicellaceae bacterium]
MDARSLLGRNMRKLRSGRGISQEHLAADSSIDRAYVSELERGVVAASVDMLDRLAAILDVPVAALFEVPAAGEKPPPNLPRGRKRA